MKRPRSIKSKIAKGYIIEPEYIKDKAALKSVMNAAAEYQQLINYAEENGAKDSGIITGLYKMSISSCLEDIANKEKWPKPPMCSTFIIKIGSCRNDFLDDLY